MSNIAVIYYSATGNVYRLAQAVAEGAADAGSNVRLLRVAETAPDVAIDSRPEWRAHVEATSDVPVATNDDLRWADGLALGTPTRFGNVSAQMKQFLDSTGPLWMAGELPGRTATAFTSTGTLHGAPKRRSSRSIRRCSTGARSWWRPGYTQPNVAGGGQGTYGVAHTAGSGLPDEAVLAAAKHQGFRLGTYTARLVASQ